MCSLIIERLADGILGVKHGVAAFIIQLLECYNNKNAATRCYLFDRELVVRDSTEPRIYQLTISGSNNQIEKAYRLPGMAFYLIAGRSLAGDRT